MDFNIDTEDLIDNNFEEWKSHSDNNENLINSVNNITLAKRYEYSQNSPNEKWNELKTHIDSKTDSTGVKAYNNKIYSSDISSGKRLLLGDLLNDLTNIEVKYDSSYRSLYLKMMLIIKSYWSRMF